MDVLTHSEIFEDPGGQLAIADVVGEAASHFRKATEKDRNQGLTQSAFWIRFELAGSALHPQAYLRVDQGTEDAQLFVDRGAGPKLVQRLGKKYPFPARSIQHRSLYLSITSDARARIHVRLESRDVLRLRVRLMAPDAVATETARESLTSGAYVGAVFALWLFNLFIFLWLHDRAYGYYLVFQGSLGLLQAAFDQLTFQFLWPDSPRWASWSEFVLVGFVYFGAAGFARTFLETDDASMRLPSRILHWLQYFSVTLVLSAPFSDASWATTLALSQSIVWSAALWLYGLLALLRRVPNAVFFVAGWSVLLVLAVFQNLVAMSWLPWEVFSDHAIRIGSVTEGVLFSLGLASRINRLRRENARIQNELLTQRLAATLHLANGIVHEIGNPLNVVKGGADDLKVRLRRLSSMLTVRSQDGETEASPSSTRSQLLASATEASELVSLGAERIALILDNVRTHASDSLLPTEPVSLGRVLEDSLALLSGRLSAQHIVVEIAASQLPEVLARPTEISQVVTNLIVNAAQAMPNGGKLMFTGHTDRDHVSLIVADTGPGIPGHLRAAVFDPFFTTRPDGMGMGLYISHQIARRHQGDLKLLDRTAGAAFQLSLPRANPL